MGRPFSRFRVYLCILFIILKEDEKLNTNKRLLTLTRRAQAASGSASRCESPPADLQTVWELFVCLAQIFLSVRQREQQITNAAAAAAALISDISCHLPVSRR